MRKTTVYIRNDLKREIERAAAARGCSEAELFREAIRALTENVSCAPAPLAIVQEQQAGTRRADRASAHGLRGTVIFLEASGLLSAIDSCQCHHAARAEALSTASPPLLVFTTH